MENRECFTLWERENDHKPLRRPNAMPNNVDRSDNLDHQMPPSRPSEGDYSILNTSRLSVDAKEWFPSSYTPQLSAVQNRLQKFKVSDPNPTPTKLFDPSKLKSIIQSLTYDPGQFDNLVDKFMAILGPHLEDMEAAHSAADMIFEVALVEPSLRYNGARLCCIIDEYCPLFRSRLHTLCERELKNSRNPQGLSLFLAELYMQLRYESIYGQSLLQSLKNLLDTTKVDDIKCICQTLKLTGYSLETKYTDTLHEIFKQLESMKHTFNQSLVNIYESTVNLRRNQWGRSNISANSSNSNISSTQDQNGYIQNFNEGELILYGPDGQEISSEEQEFLCSNIDDYLADESSDPDELFDPEPEMDAEIQAAFREFVKMSKR